MTVILLESHRNGPRGNLLEEMEKRYYVGPETCRAPEGCIRIVALDYSTSRMWPYMDLPVRETERAVRIAHLKTEKALEDSLPRYPASHYATNFFVVNEAGNRLNRKE
jgi:hypothetical protein